MEEKVKAFQYGLNRIAQMHYKDSILDWDIDVREGKKYFRLLLRSFYGYYIQNSWTCLFVDKSTGDVLIPKTSKVPDKNKVVANVNTYENGLERVAYDGSTIIWL